MFVGYQGRRTRAALFGYRQAQENDAERVIVHTHPIAAGGADAGGTATAKGRRVDEFRIFGLRIGGKAILPLVCRTDSRTI